MLTLRALKAIKAADVILYDALLDKDFHAIFPPKAEIIYTGKRCGNHSMSQDEISALLVEKCLEGKNTIRLKGGDPFIFGRGGEELLALRAAGINTEIIPGVSSAMAAAASGGFPLTHRAISRECIFIDGHNLLLEPERFKFYAQFPGTLVFYMCAGKCQQIAQALLTNEMPEQMPVVIAENVHMANECFSAGTLKEAAEGYVTRKTDGPGLIIVGEVLRLSEFENIKKELTSIKNYFDQYQTSDV